MQNFTWASYPVCAQVWGLHKELKLEAHMTPTCACFCLFVCFKSAEVPSVDAAERQHLSAAWRSGQALIKESFVFPPFTAAASCWGIHHLSQYGVIERKRSARALSLLLVFCASASSPPRCAPVVPFARHSRRLQKRLSVRGLLFRVHPNTSVFGLWRSATEVEFKSAWNQEVGGSVRDCSGAPAARRQAAVSRWISGSLSGACGRI